MTSVMARRFRSGSKIIVISACRNMELAGRRGRGRPRLTWTARFDEYMKDTEQRPGMSMEREKWSCGIMGRTSDPHKRENNRR
jgi:hypothetical protein